MSEPATREDGPDAADRRPVSAPAVPADGPDAVLVRVMRRLRLPYSQNYVTRAVAAHPRPTSLLALVEVAGTLGIEVKPYRAEASVLSELDPPLIVHFGNGFGVVEGTSEDGFEVWDSANGARTLPQDTFLEHWSGVVAAVFHDPTRRVGVLRYARHRLSDVLWGALVPPSVTGGRAATLVRLTFTALLVALLVPAVAERPAGATLVALAAVGVTLTGVMAAAGSVSSRLCARGRIVDCESVLTSRYARIAGVPLADVGIAFYGAGLGLVATGVSGAWTTVGLAYAASLPASVLLIGAQVSLRRLCVLCLGVHAVNVSGAAVAWFVTGLRGPTWDEVASLLLFALLFWLILFAVVPAFRAGRAVSRLTARQGRMSASPFLGLADVLTEAPTPVRGPECGVALGGSGPHELVAFVHPACKGCGPVLREVEVLARRGLVRVFIAVAPRDDTSEDRRLCEAIVAAGVALGPDAMLGAYTAAKEHLERGAVTDLSAGGEAGLEEARRLVARAEALADEHVEGTPAVFFDSRRYEGWLSHLAFLLENHPDLLGPVSAADESAPA